MNEIIQNALKKTSNEKITAKGSFELTEELISRDEILKKAKNLSESLKECQKQRLQTFFPEKALKTLLNPQVPTKVKKELRKLSNLGSSKDIQMNSEHPDSKSSRNSFSSSSESGNSSSSNVEAVVLFPKIILKFISPTAEYLEAKEKFDSLENEFAEKIRTRIDKRVSQSLLTHNSAMLVLNGCRSYVRFCKEAYAKEEFSFVRMYVSISMQEINVKVNARAQASECLVELTKVREIIDEKEETRISFIYLGNNYDKCIVVKPLTADDYQRWSITSRNLSKLKNIIYKTEGDLPVRTEEESQYLRHRATVLRGNADTRIPDEEDSASLKTDSDASEELKEVSEKSWDFDFEQLDNENQKEFDSQEQSFSSEDQNSKDEEKIRSLTALAALGKVEGLVNLLTKGGLFLKYGRWGKPHTRHVLLTADLKFVEWWHLNENKASGRMLSVKIISIQKGRKTKNFKRFKKPEMENKSFSLICKQRSIDLEISKDNNVPVDVWILAFEALIKQQLRKDHVVRFIIKESSIED
jgi:hypothetical protein